MWVGVLLRWVFLASALAMAATLVPGVSVDGGVGGLAGASALFGLVNLVVGPLLRRLALPLTVLTFGLVSLVVNGILLALTAGLSDALEVGGLVPAVLAALVITLIAAAAQFLLYGAAQSARDHPPTRSAPAAHPSRHRREPL